MKVNWYQAKLTQRIFLASSAHLSYTKNVPEVQADWLSMDFEEMSARNADDALRVRQYNTWMEHLQELVPKMLERAKRWSPAIPGGVIEDGHKKPSWELHRDSDGFCSVHLLPDGRLVTVDHGNSSYGTGTVSGVITLQQIAHIQEAYERGINWWSLADFYSTLITTTIHEFGLKVDHLHGAAIQHWGNEGGRFQ